MAEHPTKTVVRSRKVLIRGTNWLGDAVMSTPALLRLREALPDAHLTLLTHEKLGDLWQHFPSLDAVLTFAADENPWSVAQRLRAEGFGTALVLPNSHRSALEVWLARIPERIGSAVPWRNWFLNRPVAPRPGHVAMRKRAVREIYRLAYANSSAAASPALTVRAVPGSAHQMQEYLHLAAALGANPERVAPLVVVTAEEVQAAMSKFGLRSESVGERPMFGLNPWAEYGPAKRWPLAMFAAAAKEIQKRTNCLWLIFGGEPEVSVGAEIADALGHGSAGARKLASLTSLRELCALLKLCRVVLTNDTGPMHVAAALGTPVVALFGSTSPELTGPGLPGDTRHRLLSCSAPCAPCFHRTCPIDLRCMTGLSVESVVKAVMEVVGAQAKTEPA